MSARLLLAGSPWLLACTEQPPPHTQVIVVVGGDEAVKVLDVRVFDETGAHQSDSRALDLTRRVPGALPTSFTVQQPANGAESFRLLVQGIEMDASGATRAHARREVIATFSPGETSVLPLVLSARCAREGCTCAPNQACTRTCDPERGECVPVPRYTALPSVLPGEELEQLDEGAHGCARGSYPSADGGCADLDECAFLLDACDHDPRACVNLLPSEGRYRCECPAGFVGSGEADDPCVACATDDCSGEAP